MPHPPAAGELSPAAAWSQRVRKVGGYIQLAFAAFWLIRGALIIGGGTGTALAGAALVLVAAVLIYGIRVSAGIGRQAHQPGRQGHRAIGDHCHHHRADRLLRLPRHRHRSRPQQLGPALHRHHDRTATALARPPRAHPPLPSGVGWALTIGPVILVATMSGSALAATTGLPPASSCWEPPPPDSMTSRAYDRPLRRAEADAKLSPQAP